MNYRPTFVIAVTFIANCSVIFSDESKFIVGKYHARYVRRKTGQRYEDKFIEKGENRGRGDAMIWGAFSYFGYTPLVRIDCRLNANGYTRLLENNLLPHVNTLLPNGGVYQQDNAPIHTAATTMEWLNDNGIRTMPWPALSPDMNPIEQVWSELSCGIQGEQINNSEELFARLSNCWNTKLAQLPFREKYTSSMVRRVRALHAVRGSYTKY